MGALFFSKTKKPEKDTDRVQKKNKNKHSEREEGKGSKDDLADEGKEVACRSSTACRGAALGEDDEGPEEPPGVDGSQGHDDDLGAVLDGRLLERGQEEPEELEHHGDQHHQNALGRHSGLERGASALEHDEADDDEGHASNHAELVDEPEVVGAPLRCRRWVCRLSVCCINDIISPLVSGHLCGKNEKEK